MSSTEKIDTHQKALTLNLDATAFGSFAEIGAGQEVARWFLQVGAASGTVAKTISAYDKEVSDDLYGAGTRYVSQPRLQAMLESEWKQLISQLQGSRGATTRFFSFVNTVSARNFSGSNECHGWLGIRFQTKPGGPPSDVILHVNLQDQANLLQQEAVGVLGVNLVYAAFHKISGIEEFLTSVAEELPLSRIEIDCVEVNGPAFEGWDALQVHASLVALGLAEAVVFPANGKLLPPDEVLYKKAIVLAPGAFDVVEQFHGEIIRTTIENLPSGEVAQSKGTLGLFCLSVPPLLETRPPLSPEQIVAHVDLLRQLGYGSLVFREKELYKMCAFVNRFTKSRIHFATGLSILVRAMHDNYQDLAGSLLEGLARLFRQNVRLAVFPMKEKTLEQWLTAAGVTGWSWEAEAGMVFADMLHPEEPLNYLYRYLIGSQLIIAMRPLAK